ncbi:hypothetical protein V8F20_005329 [Naviculisporaceae sp. PSN 640]
MAQSVTDDRNPASSRALSQVKGEKIDYSDQTLWHVLATTARKRPDHEAIVSMWQTDGDGDGKHSGVRNYVRWNYKELYDKALILSEWLLCQGCFTRIRIAGFLWNSVEWALFMWASARMGYVYMPLDPRLIASDGEFLLKSTSPRVLVAQDDADAAALDTILSKSSLPYTGSRLIRIQCSASPRPGWRSLRDILSSPPVPDRLVYHGSHRAVALIIFTSGSKRRGCMHTQRNLLAQTHDYDPSPDPDQVERWLVHTPMCSIYTVNDVLCAFRLGHTVIFPAKVYDLSSTLSALVDEQCTGMSGIPPLVKALVAHPKFPGKDKLKLRTITLWATIVTREDMKLCRYGLGAQHAIQAFGLTEGAPIISWCRQDELLVKNGGYHPGMGRVLPGANVRVCKPGSREIVERGTMGELHVSGDKIITSYLDSDTDESFYDDGMDRWFITGDQAKIDEHGVVYVLGRVEDGIIRAGDIVSSKKLERAIARVKGVKTAQVVGLANASAGQVPAAIVQVADGVDKDAIKPKIMAISRDMGPKYILDAVYLLSELGLESFPVKSPGKTRCKKAALAEAIEELRQRAALVKVVKKPVTCKPPVKVAEEVAQEHKSGRTVSEWAEELRVIWEGLTEHRPGLDESVANFADKITMVRFCEWVQVTLGQPLGFEDLVDHDTINKQAALIQLREEYRLREEEERLKQEEQQKGKQVSSTSSVSTPPPSSGSPRGSNSTVATDVPFQPFKVGGASPLPTTWTNRDVEDVLFIPDNYLDLAVGPQPFTCRLRISKDWKPEEVRKAIEDGLECRSIFRAMLALLPYGPPFHIILAPSAALFDRLIHEATVPDQAAREALERYLPSLSHSTPFMAQFWIITVQSPSGPQITVSATFNRTIVDAWSLCSWHTELEMLLRENYLKLPVATSFRLYSEIYHLYRVSLPAQFSVEHLVRRLRGISLVKSSVWPPQRAPGWLLLDNGCPPEMASIRNSTREQVWDGKWKSYCEEELTSNNGVPRVGRNVSLTGGQWLAETRQISCMLLIKCAIAIFNAFKTKSDYAIFTTMHHGRSWPFVTSWMADKLPRANTIVGPTTEWTLEVCIVNPENQTVGGLLEQMKLEHELLECHCHVPWEQVLVALAASGEEERQVAKDARFRQVFAWNADVRREPAGGKTEKLKALEPVAQYCRPDCGLFWNAFMPSDTNLFFTAEWDSAQMNLEEVEGYCDQVADIVNKLMEEQNWDRKINEVFGEGFLSYVQTLFAAMTTEVV